MLTRMRYHEFYAVQRRLFRKLFASEDSTLQVQNFMVPTQGAHHRVICMALHDSQKRRKFPQRRFAIWRRLSLAFPVVCCTWTINTHSAPFGPSGTHAHTSELQFENYLIKSVNLTNNRVDKMKMKIEEPAMQEMMRGVKDVDDEEEEPQEVKQIATRFCKI